MNTRKKALKKTYLKHIRRAERERDIIDRARDRKYYHEKQANLAFKNLELVQNGQLEFKDL